MNRFKVFSKVYRVIEHEDREDETVHVKGDYCLLEPVTSEWDRDLGRGLARFLRDDLDKLVNSIQYYYNTDGYICFSVDLKVDPDTEYNGTTVYNAVCKYLSGQISDGWGENGIILYNWIKCETLFCDLSYELYKEDWNASHKLAEKNGDRFFDFEKYPVYSEIN